MRIVLLAGGLVLGALVVAACSGSDTNGSPDPPSGDAGLNEPADGGGGVPDGGSAEGGDSGTPKAAPIVAPPDTWTWVDFPDSKCASGTPTGIGVNPHAGADSVVLYLEGGGGCTTATTCWGPDPSARSLDGYDAAKFAATPQVKFPLLSRSAANPLADASMVFVPYCTGDLHGGATTTNLTLDGKTIPTYFWGAKNVSIYLARLVATFPETKRVYLAGGSAGGFGTLLNFARVAEAFGVRVDVIDDSGPPILPKGADSNGALKVWGYAPPAGCATCTSMPGIYAFNRQKQPASRFALLSYAQDGTISSFFGYSIGEYPGVLDAFTASVASDPNAGTFIVTGVSGHVLQSKPALAVQYLPWIEQMVTDSASWTSTTYAVP